MVGKTQKRSKASSLPRKQVSSLREKTLVSTIETRGRRRKVKIQGQGNAAAKQLFHKWLTDESGYDEKTWPPLKRALEENRVSSRRRLFSD